MHVVMHIHARAMISMQYARKTRIANPDEAGEATILQTGLAVCRSMHEELEIRLQVSSPMQISTNLTPSCAEMRIPVG